MSETTELRFERAPASLAQALDVLAMVEGMSRREYCLRELERLARRELDKIRMQHQALRGNPLYEEPRKEGASCGENL